MALKETLEGESRCDFAHSVAAISLLRAVYVVPLKEPIVQALACNQTHALSP
jgi:hypothetical protein